MRPICRILFPVVFVLTTVNAQVIPPVSEGNAVVYFLRSKDSQVFDPSMLYFDNQPSGTSSLYGGLASGSVGYAGVHTNDMKFILFDSTKVIGRLDIISYMRYECKAGPHLFWSRGKTSDFVEADLAPGKVYFIHISGKLRERGPDLKPINPENMFWMEGILRFIDSKSDDNLARSKCLWLQKKQRRKINKALMRYEDAKYKGHLPGKLEEDMYFRPLNIPDRTF